MTVELEGEAAKKQAAEWNYDGDLSKVVRTTKASHIACAWVWTDDGVGRCQACGDWDSKLLEEAE